GAEVGAGRRGNPGRKVLVPAAELDGAPQGRQSQVPDLKVLGSVVGLLLRRVFPLEAVDNVAVVVHDEDVLNPNVFVVEQRIFDTAEDFIEVLFALQTIHAEGDS